MSFWAIIDHLLYKNYLNNATNIDLGLNFMYEITLRFIWVILLLVTIQNWWKTTKRCYWNSVKGDCDHLIEVKL